METGRQGSEGRDQAEEEERGATLVEYALLVALVALVALSSMTMLRNRSKEKYEESQSGITEVAGVVIEAPDGGSTDGSSTPPPAISPSCAGSATCSFSLTNLPEGSSVTWTTSPFVEAGSGPSFSFTGEKNGGPYTVTATIEPGGETVNKTVTCTKGNTTVCTAD